VLQVRVWDVLFTEGGTRSVFQLRVALALLKIFEPILLKKNSFEGIMEVFKVVLQSMWNSQQVRLKHWLFLRQTFFLKF
jgi:hypothetical protein